MAPESLPPISPAAALTETLSFAARQGDGVLERPETAPWLVSAIVLAAQQAAALALRAAGERIPAQAGATELLLRAASKDRLPAPYTLPFSAEAQRRFAGVVDARNAAMHPRGTDWQIGAETLSAGLTVAIGAVRHLVLVQPVIQGLLSPDQTDSAKSDLEALEALAEFLDPGAGLR